MKVILKDFIYKGMHIDEFECDLGAKNEFDEDFKDRIVEYLEETLDLCLK